MRKIFGTALILLLSGALSGCEGYRITHGVVKDKKSGIVLDGVLCKVINGDNNEDNYTDINGRFEVHGTLGGCIPNCPEIIVRFSKINYKALEIKNSSDTVFYLTKQKK